MWALCKFQAGYGGSRAELPDWDGHVIELSEAFATSPPTNVLRVGTILLGVVEREATWEPDYYMKSTPPHFLFGNGFTTITCRRPARLQVGRIAICYRTYWAVCSEVSCTCVGFASDSLDSAWFKYGLVTLTLGDCNIIWTRERPASGNLRNLRIVMDGRSLTTSSFVTPQDMPKSAVELGRDGHKVELPKFYLSRGSADEGIAIEDKYRKWNHFDHHDDFSRRMNSDIEDLGGRVARIREEMKHSVFFFAYSAFDVDFISVFYDGTYRVMSKGGRIVPAHRHIPWEGFLGQPKPVEKPKKNKRKREVEDVGGRAVVVEAEESGILGGLARFVTGLMTPAASMASQAEKKSH
ncbi:hypothetical protein DFH08DRAFT_822314 [Mycena albidolilacea]|uniref:Uncharacterized protein n=1 Tax=Mycena albidolilacea TaxID=1033008 RepID=A0AAD6Z975_9AGAR|nr:hypothetical protein DFH08DRAFT_822314 [Mycena albidolilacea]